jgi:hypothetical protein
MALHGVTWRYMALHGVTWRYMALHGITWRYMALHGVTWRYMELMALHGFLGCHVEILLSAVVTVYVSTCKCHQVTATNYT